MSCRWVQAHRGTSPPGSSTQTVIAMPGEAEVTRSSRTRWLRVFCAILGIGTALYILRTYLGSQNSKPYDVIIVACFVAWWTTPYLLLIGRSFSNSGADLFAWSALLFAGIECLVFGKKDEFSGHDGLLGVLVGPITLIIFLLPAIIGLELSFRWAVKNIRWR